MNYIKPEDIKEYVSKNPEGIAGMSEELAAMVNHFAELIVAECINREELLGAIARGWCGEKNSHKEMDSDLAVAIFDEVEQQIKQKFGVE